MTSYIVYDCEYCSAYSQCRDKNKGHVENCSDFIEKEYMSCNEDRQTSLLRYNDDLSA